MSSVVSCMRKRLTHRCIENARSQQCDGKFIRDAANEASGAHTRTQAEGGRRVFLRYISRSVWMIQLINRNGNEQQIEVNSTKQICGHRHSPMKSPRISMLQSNSASSPLSYSIFILHIFNIFKWPSRPLPATALDGEWCMQRVNGAHDSHINFANSFANGECVCVCIGVWWLAFRIYLLIQLVVGHNTEQNRASRDCHRTTQLTRWTWARTQAHSCSK